MRKILVLTVALLCYFCTYSQEANTSDNIPVLIIAPRFDVNPYIATGDGGLRGVDFGNSSLCTLLEGSIGEHFSYSMSNHWVTSQTRPLYQNILRTDESDFIDWLTLSYSVGRFTFTVGKDMVAIGGYELDPMDVIQHPLLCSKFFNDVSIYQLSGKVEYTTKDESSTFGFQFANSIFSSLKPFEERLFAYSLTWYGDYEWFAPIWSANLLEYERGRFVKMASLGSAFYFGDATIELDLMYKHLNYEGSNHEFTPALKFNYNFNDKVEIFARGGYEYRSGMDILGWSDEEFGYFPTDISGGNYAFYGAGVHYYPLRNSTDLRLHTIIASNSHAKSIAINVGVTYLFNLTDTIRKHR